MPEPAGPASSNPEADAAAALEKPHGPVLSPVEARTGARRGIYRILTISIGLTIVAFLIAWWLIAGTMRTGRPQADPERPPASDTGATTSAPPKPAS